MAWPDSQQREVEVVVQAAQVAGSGTLSSFPVLLTRANLPDEICSPTDGNRAQADGGDIRAGTASGMGTRLALQIVNFEYDSTDGAGDAEIEIWVLRDIDGASDTSIWLGYNTSGTDSQPAADAAFGSEAVWAGFVSVWHMDDTGTSNVFDSSPNTHNGTLTNGAAFVAGKIAGGVEFDGDNDFIELGAIPTSDPIQLNGTNFTFSIWVRPDATGDSFQRIIDKSDDGFGQNGYAVTLANDPTNGYNFYANDATVAINIGVNTADTWTRFTVVHTGSGNYSFYQDGAFVSSVTGAAAPPLSEQNMRIGTWNHSTGREFNGTMDDFTIAATDFSADWIATEYANQNTPATFAVEGTPQGTGAGSVVSVAGSFAAVSAAGAVASAARTASGQSDATSASMAAGGIARGVSGSAEATSIVTGFASRLRQAVGQIVAASSTISASGVARSAIGSADSVSAASGFASRLRAAAGQIVAASTLSGAVATAAEVLVAGAMAAVSSASAAASVARGAAGQVVSSAALSGATARAGALAGQVVSASTVAARSAVARFVAGVSAIISTLSGAATKAGVGYPAEIIQATLAESVQIAATLDASETIEATLMAEAQIVARMPSYANAG